ncbi:MAG: zinc ribbon domain-containing protein [Defluviitaleaceae bacterium]|nr:zinc ribbon domain-containing protein [Defluviitaleaceae bacterium]
MFCIQCGHELASDSEFCIECGTKVQEPSEEQEGFCTQCGTKLPEDSAFCTECGAEVVEPEDERFCTECGQKLEDDSEFCSACGTKAAAETDESTPVDEQVIAEPTDSPEISNAATDIPEETVAVEQPEVHIVDVDDFPLQYPIPTPVEVPPWEGDKEEIVKYNDVPETEPITKEIAKQRKLVMGLFGITIALLAVVVTLIVFITINRGDEGGGWRGSAGQQEHDPTANMTREEYHIHRIVTGTLHNHPDVQIGPALDRFFTGIPVWAHFIDADDDYVSVHGEAIVDGETAMVQFLFQFSPDSEIFAPTSLILRGAFQDIVLLFEMLDDIMVRGR